jgi:hypothetical protein
MMIINHLKALISKNQDKETIYYFSPSELYILNVFQQLKTLHKKETITNKTKEEKDEFG